MIILERYLNKLRESIADGFEEAKIVSPVTMSYTGGVYTCKVKELVGARMPFNEIIIESTVALDTNKLYLVHQNQYEPIELLPFIKFIEISNAVYFYSSIESVSVRWVSYHFAELPEETVLDVDDFPNIFKRYFKDDYEEKE